MKYYDLIVMSVFNTKMYARFEHTSEGKQELRDYLGEVAKSEDTAYYDLRLTDGHGHIENRHFQECKAYEKFIDNIS